MSIKSAIAAAIRGAATALRAAGRVSRLTAGVAAIAMVTVTKVVVDTVTGVVRVVRELVAPQPPVSAAQAQADAYLDAASGPAPVDPAAAAAAEATAGMDALLAAYPELADAPTDARQYPEAHYLRAWARHAIQRPGHGPVDESILPQRIRLWLHSLDDGSLHRVAVAPLMTLDRHLRARSQVELMRDLPACLTDKAARAAAEARRDRLVTELARGAGATPARSSDPEQAALDDLLDATAEAGPAPRPF